MALKSLLREIREKVVDSDDDAADLVAADGSSTMTVEDASAFDCGICYLPFKPPIFQCIEGHAVCSTCHVKLIKTVNKQCHVCRADMSRGYMRCHSMERMVEAVRVPCPYVAHGCTARLTYFDRSSHRKACPYARYSCPGHGCGFVGTAGAMLDHVAIVHANKEAMREFWTAELSRLMARLKLGTAAAEMGTDGVDPKDIELIMLQATVSMDIAVKTLKECNGDIVSAIVDLTKD